MTEIDLLETSLVAMPAQPRAKVLSVKSLLRPTDPRSLEASLRDELGFSVREAKRLVSGGWRALVGDDGSDDELQQIAALLQGAAQSL